MGSGLKELRKQVLWVRDGEGVCSERRGFIPQAGTAAKCEEAKKLGRVRLAFGATQAAGGPLHGCQSVDRGIYRG